MVHMISFVVRLAILALSGCLTYIEHSWWFGEDFVPHRPGHPP